jgi:hypothetical protein
MTERKGESHGFRHVGHSDLSGYGDGMQVLRHHDAVYVGHFGISGMGTTVLDASDPAQPRVVRQLPAPAGTHRHKVQVGDGLLLVNEEQFRGAESFSEGLLVFSLDDPFDPQPVGRMPTGGKGVHRIVWTGGRFASMSATPAGHDDRIWIVVDMERPDRPVEAGRWEWPEPAPPGKRYAAHHALFDGELGYLGYCDAGMVVLDVSDPTAPRRIGHLNWSPGGDTHTCLPLPGRRLVVVTDEALKERCAEEEKRVRVVDVSYPTDPRVVGLCPRPEGDFCERGLRFGPHNLHENLPGSYRSEQIVFVTYFNAGLRVYDLADPAAPVEIAHWIPDLPAGQEDVQTNDLYVEESGRVWVTDRISGGLDVLEPAPELTRRLEEARL